MRLWLLILLTALLLATLSTAVEIDDAYEVSDGETSTIPPDADHKSTTVQTSSRRRKRTTASMMTRKTRAASTPSQTSTRRSSSPAAKPAKQKTSMMDFFKQILLLWQLKEKFLNRDKDEGTGYGPMPHPQQPPPMMMNGGGYPQQQQMNNPRMNRINNGNFYGPQGGMPMNNFGPGMGFFPQNGFRQPMQSNGFGQPMRPQGFMGQPRPQQRRGGGGSLSPEELANMMNTFQAVTNADGGREQIQPARVQAPPPPMNFQGYANGGDDQSEITPPPRRKNLRERRRTVDWVKEALLKFTSNDDRQRESDVINPIGRRSRGKSISSMLKMFPVCELYTPLVGVGLLDFYVKWAK